MSPFDHFGDFNKIVEFSEESNPGLVNMRPSTVDDASINRLLHLDDHVMGFKFAARFPDIGSGSDNMGSPFHPFRSRHGGIPAPFHGLVPTGVDS